MMMGVDLQLGVLLGTDVVVPEAELQVRSPDFVILDDHDLLLVHTGSSWSSGHLGGSDFQELRRCRRRTEREKVCGERLGQGKFGNGNQKVSN